MEFAEKKMLVQFVISQEVEFKYWGNIYPL